MPYTFHVLFNTHLRFFLRSYALSPLHILLGSKHSRRETPSLAAHASALHRIQVLVNKIYTFHNCNYSYHKLSLRPLWIVHSWSCSHSLGREKADTFSNVLLCRECAQIFEQCFWFVLFVYIKEFTSLCVRAYFKSKYMMFKQKPEMITG